MSVTFYTAKMSLPNRARTARLSKELSDLEKRPPWGITCFPEKEDNLDELRVFMNGPKNTPYSRGVFKLSVSIPERYPFVPPLVKFITPIYHPNIDRGGRICMDMLKPPPKGNWLPTITLETLLVSLQTLLVNPNPDDPLMLDIANEFKHDRDNFELKAGKFTVDYATGQGNEKWPEDLC